MKKYILAIDQGTTGTTSLLIDTLTFELVDKASKEIPQFFPQAAWVEHDFNKIWESIASTILSLLERNHIKGSQIECIGITNQRETVCALNRQGLPLAKGIVWQDRRTVESCEFIKNKYNSSLIKQKTGLPIDPYFSGTKIKWLLENNNDVKRARTQNNLIFTTVDSFILLKLTNGKSFATDASNASRTLLMNLNTACWDPELLNIFSAKSEELAEIKESFTLFGKTENLNFLPDGIPITGILGDQQAALFGQAGFEQGSIKCTYGTGAFMLYNTGKEPIFSSKGLLSTIAYRYQKQNIYALEGSSYIAGAAVQWLRDQLKIIKQSSDIEQLAAKVLNASEMEDVFFLPFFSGIGTPHWKPNAKAIICGLSRDTSNAHIARACLEGIAFSINDLLQTFLLEQNIPHPIMKVDGGAVVNSLLMQIQSNISNIKIIKPKVIETTAYGAGLAAAVGHGILKDFNDIKKYWNHDISYEPNDEKTFYLKKKTKWEEHIKRFYS